MKVLFLLPILMIVYLVYARIKFGMTRSISATYGKLTKLEQLLPITVLIVSVIVPTIVLGFNANPDSPFAFLWWFAGFLILLVGTFPHNKADSVGEKLHVVGATGGIFFGMLAPALTLQGWWNILIPSLYVLFVGVQELTDKKIKNNTYWTEVIAIGVVIGLLAAHYIS